DATAASDLAEQDPRRLLAPADIGHALELTRLVELVRSGVRVRHEEILGARSERGIGRRADRLRRLRKRSDLRPMHVSRTGAHDGGNEGGYDPILICYDGTAGSRRAIEAAAELVGPRRATVLDIGPVITGAE